MKTLWYKAAWQKRNAAAVKRMNHDYYMRNKGRIAARNKAWKDANKTRIAQRAKERVLLFPEKHREMRRIQRQRHTERRKNYNKIWKQKNAKRIGVIRLKKRLSRLTPEQLTCYYERKERCRLLKSGIIPYWKDRNRDYTRAYNRLRYATNSNFRIKRILSSGISKRLKSAKCRKVNHFRELIGCSIEQLKAHLESQFKPGMSWSNRGMFGWHIDHIKPVASFNLQDPEQQKKCFNYTNLQPLWWHENIAKSDSNDWHTGRLLSEL